MRNSHRERNRRELMGRETSNAPSPNIAKATVDLNCTASVCEDRLLKAYIEGADPTAENLMPGDAPIDGDQHMEVQGYA